MLCTILDKTNFGLCKRPRNKKNIHTELMNYFFRDRFQNGSMIMVDIFMDPNMNSTVKKLDHAHVDV